MKSGFDAAWENHKRKNPHHHETAKSHLDIAHMIIGWTAMGYKFGDTAKNYYESNKSEINPSPEHESFAYEIFDRIEKFREGA